MRFKVVITSRNCYDAHQKCLASLLPHMNNNVDVCIVDDASEDREQAWYGMAQASLNGWLFKHNEERLGAMRSQYEAIQALQPEPEDVIVWLDGDDQLHAGQQLWNVLYQHYRAGAMMTYGSYITNPADGRCSPARVYPPECDATNDYRNFKRWGMRFNHLRTVKYELFRHLDPETDFKDANGDWYMTGCDAAVMIPCLELAGGRYRRIPQPLYVYTSDNPNSDWRVHAADLRAVHTRIASQPKKESLWPISN